MSVKEDVKYLLAKEAMTMKQLAEFMKEKTGYPYNLKVISDKLARKTLKYEEFKIIKKEVEYLSTSYTLLTHYSRKSL